LSRTSARGGTRSSSTPIRSDYLHSHPTEALPEGTERANLRGGPEVEFGAMFPEAGLYRIWTQFQRGGRVSTISFTVKVNSPASR
jgi:hypothetical protein